MRPALTGRRPGPLLLLLLLLCGPVRSVTGGTTREARSKNFEVRGTVQYWMGSLLQWSSGSSPEGRGSKSRPCHNEDDHDRGPLRCFGEGLSGAREGRACATSRRTRGDEAPRGISRDIPTSAQPGCRPFEGAPRPSTADQRAVVLLGRSRSSRERGEGIRRPNGTSKTELGPSLRATRPPSLTEAPRAGVTARHLRRRRAARGAVPTGAAPSAWMSSSICPSKSSSRDSSVIQFRWSKFSRQAKPWTAARRWMSAW